MSYLPSPAPNDENNENAFPLSGSSCGRPSILSPTSKRLDGPSSSSNIPISTPPPRTRISLGNKDTNAGADDEGEWQEVVRGRAPKRETSNKNLTSISNTVNNRSLSRQNSEILTTTTPAKSQTYEEAEKQLKEDMPPPPPLNNNAAVAPASLSKSRFGYSSSLPVKSSGYGRPSDAANYGNPNPTHSSSNDSRDSSVSSERSTRSTRSSTRTVDGDSFVSTSVTRIDHAAEKAKAAASYADAIRRKRMSATGLAACSPARQSLVSAKNSTPSAKAGTPNGNISIVKKVMSTFRGNNTNTPTKQQPLTPSSSSMSTPNASTSTASSALTSSAFPIQVLQFDPSVSEVRGFFEVIYGHNSGLSDDELKQILGSRVAGKSWELKKKVEASNEMLKKLKDCIVNLQKGKNRFKALSVEAELAAKKNWATCATRVISTDKENEKLRTEVKSLSIVAVNARDKQKDSERMVRQYKDKSEQLEKELKPLRVALNEAESKHGEVKLKLSAAEGRAMEATNMSKTFRADLLTIEAKKSDAVKDAEGAMTTKFEVEIEALRKECAELKSKMNSNEDELSRLVSYSNDGTPSTTITGVKLELERLRLRNAEGEQLILTKNNELSRVQFELENVKISKDAKEKDFMQLMLSIGEIQKSGQAREDESKECRKEVEIKLAESERNLNAANNEITKLVSEKESLVETLSTIKSTLLTAEEQLVIVKAELVEFKSGSNGLEAQLKVEKELRSRAEAKELEEKHERVAMSAQMMAMTLEHARVEAKRGEEQERGKHDTGIKISGLEKKLETNSALLDEANEQRRGLESERDGLKEALNSQQSAADAETKFENSRLRGEVEILREKLKNAELRNAAFGEKSAEDVSQLELQLQKMKVERRKMHNVIQELRGNVRVFARIRPFLPDDGDSTTALPSIVPRSEFSLKVTNAEKQDSNFDFDKVFPPSIGQAAVFAEVSEFVQSALDGYNVCLFSYGQTGSGKTHTMQGSGNDQMRGIIPRAIEQVGEYKKQLERDGWKYEMKVSFLEIYNETIRDLLRENKHEEVKHEVKVDSNGRRYVSDLSMIKLEPTDSKQVEEVMRQAAKHRSVACTDMNSVSSRSHSVFTLHLVAKHEEHKQCLRGTLNLVDLAGSERLERSGATGQQAKEAMAINKSLSCLTDVFSAIGKKAAHIPFRNSKLTYLLQPSLSGDGKTLMMVNLSPTEDSKAESMCSLRFASQVNKCELGKPKKSIDDIESGERPTDITASTSCSRSSTASSSSSSSSGSSVKSGVRPATAGIGSRTKAGPSTPPRIIRPATSTLLSRSAKSPGRVGVVAKV